MTPAPFDAAAFRRELDTRPHRGRGRDWTPARRPTPAHLEAEDRLYGLVDEPPDPAIVAEAAWADRLADEDEDRTLSDELPPGYCPRWWGRGGERL